MCSLTGTSMESAQIYFIPLAPENMQGKNEVSFERLILEFHTFVNCTIFRPQKTTIVVAKLSSRKKDQNRISGTSRIYQGDVNFRCESQYQAFVSVR